MNPIPRRSLYIQTPSESGRRSKRRKRHGRRTETLLVRHEPSERHAWASAAAIEGYLSLSDWIRDRLNGAAKSRAMLSSDRMDWNTPQEVIDALAPLGPIGLDPCSNAGSIVPAAVAWTEVDDGLPRAWTGFGLVYVNPPYGYELPTWIEKCGAEAANGAELVVLVPARPDTQWMGHALETGAVVGLWRGRLTFLAGGTSAPFPSALLYWGPRGELFRDVVAHLVTGFLEGAYAA